MPTETMDPAQRAARTAEYQTAIRAFAELYDYDMSYQAELLAGSFDAFEAFQRAMPTSSFRRALSLEAHFVARLASMVGEDCGDCILVNARMAVRSGVDRALVAAALEQSEALPEVLRDLHAHALAVSRGRITDTARTARLQRSLGPEGFAELAVVLAGCRIFTTVKRSLGHGQARAVAPSDY